MLQIGDTSDKHFMASGRFIPLDEDPVAWIRHLWPEYASRVDEVYGFVPEQLRLYGGRPPGLDNGLSDRQIACLRDHGIGFSLNLTNHYFNDEAYREARQTLQRLHVDGNSIVCTNDRLAERLRADFPRFRLKASVLKHLNTKAKLEAALELYDRVVVPIFLSDDESFLQSLEPKDRIVPWATCFCAYNCREWTCWASTSRKWMGVSPTGRTEVAIRRCLERHAAAVPLAFNLDASCFAGYKRFKLAQPSARIKRVQ